MTVSLLSFSFFFVVFLANIIFRGRVFLALVERQEDRGTVVAQGGGKVEHSDKYIQFSPHSYPNTRLQEL